MRLTPEEQAILKRIGRAQQEQQQDDVASMSEWWEKWLPDEEQEAHEQADPRCHKRIGSHSHTWWRLVMCQNMLSELGRPSKLRFVWSRKGKVLARP